MAPAGMPEAPAPTRAETRRSVLAAAAAAIVALLPLLPALLAGQSLYFRDLGRYYFPLRRYVVEGLARGELRYWNPFVHEGLQELFPPVSYPLELLQVLLPDERGFTLLLALHLPLAASGFFLLARALGTGPVAAAAGGVAYALGGFSLSSLCLYEYTHALAWTPLVVLAFRHAAAGGGRRVVPAALAAAVLLSTGRIEIALQGLLAAFLLAAAGRDRRRWGRLVTSLGLGMLLAAPTLLVMRATVEGSRRAGGLDDVVMLARSVHPVSLLQAVVANLHGDLGNLVGRFWGERFFDPGTFPYFASLYLGAIVLGLAALGAGTRGPCRWPLLGLAALALWLSLGSHAGLGALVGTLPEAVRAWRFPVKAFFTVHLAFCLLAALGLQSLERDEGRRWRRLAVILAASGLALFATLAIPRLPAATARLGAALLPPHYSEPQQTAIRGLVAGDAARGGALALLAAAVALTAARGRIRSATATVLVTGVLAADLLRAGAGLNPSVTREFFDLSHEMTREVERLRAGGGRIFTCRVPTSRAYQDVRPRQWDSLDVWTLTLMRETLTPYYNVPDSVPTAYGDDLTMLVPLERVSPPGRGECAGVPSRIDELRQAGVSHVLSLDPIEHPDLALASLVRTKRLAPLVVRVYALRGALPLRAVAREVVAVPWGSGGAGRSPDEVVVEGGSAVENAIGRILAAEEGTQSIRLRVEADRSTMVVLRDAWAPGWRARVNAREAPVLRADGRHRAVPIPAGESELVLRYRPPGLALGLLLAAASGCVLVALWIRGS
jgi:hypothetical protein